MARWDTCRRNRSGEPVDSRSDILIVKRSSTRCSPASGVARGTGGRGHGGNPQGRSDGADSRSRTARRSSALSRCLEKRGRPASSRPATWPRPGRADWDDPIAAVDASVPAAAGCANRSGHGPWPPLCSGTGADAGTVGSSRNLGALQAPACMPSWAQTRRWRPSTFTSEAPRRFRRTDGGWASSRSGPTTTAAAVRPAAFAGRLPLQDRLRARAVLFPGLALDRVLRRRQAEEERDHGGAASSCGRAEHAGRRVER